MQLSMEFASVTEGYVNLGGTTDTGFTDNGGRTWSVVKVPSQPTDLSIADGSLWITATHCPLNSSDTSLCPTELARYAVAARSPSVVSVIPVEGPVLSESVNANFAQTTLWIRHGEEGLVTEGSTDGLHTSILGTVDAGHHWTVISDPCTELEVAGLVQLSASHFALYCNLDGGMHQGMNQLWTTTDNGQVWALTAQGSEEDPSQDVGNIGDGMMGDLTASGNGSILWTLGDVDGLSYSTKGGSIWGGAPLVTDGYPGQIVTVGATEAWLPLPGLGLYRTLNGTQWTQLP